MSEADTPPAVIDYARVSADDEWLGRYLRLVLGGSLLFYGTCGTIAAALYHASIHGLIDTTMTYDETDGTLSSIVNSAAAVGMTIAGPCVLWGQRSFVITGGLIARLMSAAIIVMFVCEWAWSLGMARRESADLDAWYWFASFVHGAAYLVIPFLIGLLAKAPAFTRICAAAKIG